MTDRWLDALSPWEGFTGQAEEFRELDEERVVALTRNSGRGRRSGVELDPLWTRSANLFHIREGK